MGRPCAMLALIPFSILFAQTPPEPAAADPAEPAPARWNLYYQATAIGQYHGRFHSPYEGPFSLHDSQERDISLTTTLFFGLRLGPNTQLYFDPEIAGGRGFSGVNGIANFPNGELPRVASATPKPYLARLYITQEFGFGTEKEKISTDANQLGGERPATRYSITVGRFTVTDFFDNNRYSHDPRTQFMGWGIMYNGAWDYPADTRGYTWGWVHEFHAKNWSLRYGSAAEPRVANGLRFDRRILVNRGDTFEGERDYSVGNHPGAVRVLAYFNHSNSGTYADAIKLGLQNGTRPDVTATRRNGTLKKGVGLNAEQEIAKDIGIFARLGWNDGKTESFAFTAIDRLLNAGVSVAGTRWRRRHDTAASAITVSGLSGIHADYLARGGLDFLIGDGKLRYGTEQIWESYYSARLFPSFFATFDLQHIQNPAFNRDRGPVWVSSLRLHLELGKDTFLRH
ncbi:MAG TPA: carbohydrate porin [Bryobacteraceae bacterium]|nr:carbohydrate porin [Bryobacteraceae bacterium]